MTKQILRSVTGSFFIAIAIALLPFKLQAQEKPNAGLTLPAGFKAAKLIENIGGARHIFVTPQGNIFVKLSGRRDGKGILMLHESDGKAEVKAGFGNYGGTGIFVRGEYLYAASNSTIFRYKLDASNNVLNPDAPDTLISGLVNGNEHNTKSITMDNAGNIYIPIGAPSNSCQEKDRGKGSMGIKGCPLLETAGGVWQFRADKLNQTYKDGVRYATGLRNVVAVDWNQQTNQLYVMQHGRDQLNSIFPDMYTIKQSAELPAECMYALKNGDNAGWPYIYYDGFKNKKILAPEYGGDGVKEGSSEFIDPAAAYPAHMAPNGLLFYTGNQFPARYKNGAFIAFHGSWNRAPEPQAGYFVVFQPFKNGKPSGKWEVFADGFSGSPEKTAAGRAEHRPCGLSVGPDGSLYITDDVKGAIYKVSYTKAIANKTAAVTGKKATKTVTSTTKSVVQKKTLVKAAAQPTFNAVMSAGKAVYIQNCAVCHQNDGGGVQNMNPPLGGTSYIKGSKAKLISIILKGLSQEEIDGNSYSNVMPAHDFLTDKQIANVLSYVRNSFGNKAGIVTEAEVKAARKG